MEYSYILRSSSSRDLARFPWVREPDRRGHKCKRSVIERGVGSELQRKAHVVKLKCTKLFYVHKLHCVAHRKSCMAQGRRCVMDAQLETLCHPCSAGATCASLCQPIPLATTSWKRRTTCAITSACALLSVPGAILRNVCFHMRVFEEIRQLCQFLQCVI